MSSSPSSSSPDIPLPNVAPAKEDFTYKHATYEEVIEDLLSRFILNLPDEELASIERICFQIEQAHWFYEDFIREENPKFPTLPLKRFSAMLFETCPLLHQYDDHEQAFSTFMEYKTKVPVCGAIMLNESWDKCVLVKGWKSSSGWGFPKGKINEDEPKHTCAIREVLEETGYNLARQIRVNDVIELSVREQTVALYIVPGVPEDFPFKTRTRKEISKIEWFKLADLPTWKRNKPAPGKFYLISPFIAPLRAFVNTNRPRGVRKPKARKDRRADVPSTYDTHPESSSQSDFGDPHTPQTTELHTAHVDSTMIHSDQQPEDKPAPIDPHFARLLSSLVNGAAISQADPPPKSPSVNSLAEHRQTPVGAKLTPGDGSSNVSADVPPPPPRNRSGSPQSSGSLHNTGSTRLSHRPGRLSHHSSYSSSFIPSPSSQVAVAVDIPPKSPKANDAEAPSSIKHRRQLALLQSVAAESARMAMTPPLPSASVPPLESNNILYSSQSQGPIGPGFPQLGGNYGHNPALWRPQTSQSFLPHHNYPMTTSAMSHISFPHFGIPYQPARPSFQQVQSQFLPMGTPPGPGVVHGNAPSPLLHNIPASIPAAGPWNRSPAARYRSADNQLLSILNGAPN